MSFLKNEKKKTDSSSKKTKSSKKNISNESKDVIVKKKTKISFGRKKNKNLEKNVINTDKETKKEDVEAEIDEPELVHNVNSIEKNDLIEDVFVSDQETETIEKEVGKQRSSTKKKKRILTKDMKDKPVFLEDTGEKLGIVHDMMYDDNKIIGYKIKDKNN